MHTIVPATMGPLLGQGIMRVMIVQIFVQPTGVKAVAPAGARIKTRTNREEETPPI